MLVNANLLVSTNTAVVSSVRSHAILLYNNYPEMAFVYLPLALSDITGFMQLLDPADLQLRVTRDC